MEFFTPTGSKEFIRRKKSIKLLSDFQQKIPISGEPVHFWYNIQL
jgi:hypothetical protein